MGRLFQELPFIANELEEAEADTARQIQAAFRR